MALFNRLDYIDGQTDERGALVLDNTANNTNLLSQQPSNGIFANEYTINQVISRLQNYDYISPNNYSSV